MEKQQLQQTKKIIDVAGRRKALIITCILLGISVGLITYLLQPKIYQATSLLSYQQQKVDRGKMSPGMQAAILDIVSTLTQIVTSRTSLERIINNDGLYKKQLASLPMEDVIESMRRDISITPSKRGDTFHISFMGNNPQKVVRVTNGLSSRFIEENLKYREEKASETSKYTQEELTMTKNMLDRKEVVMRDYKLKHYNEMPDQRDSNMARLISLQDQYQNRQDSIQDLERTRVLIRDQIGARERSIEQQKNNAITPTMDGQESSIEPDIVLLNRLKISRQYLQEKYTDKHPKMISLKKKIFHLEESINESQKGGYNVTKTDGKPDETFDQVLFDLQLQLKGIGLSIKKIKQEKEEFIARIEQVEEWVAASPIREAEWTSLTREYGEFKRRYDYLVGQNLQAGSALNLERKQKGSQFKIEDPARLPSKPVKPDFIRIMLIALAAGCGLGGALAILIDMLDSSFRDPDTIEGDLGVEVICTVPLLQLQSEVRKQRLLTTLGSVFFLTWTAAIVVAFVFYWQQGQIILGSRF